MFALSPKTNRKTIALWIKSIRPAIDDILSERLGDTHNASLVRWGRNGIQAELCILIESPNIPSPDTQESIRVCLADICCDNDHPSIKARFLQGIFRKLCGSQDAKFEAKESEESHLHYSWNRPCKYPGMGASLGLLCSTKVSATLGGYIEIPPNIYVLTSDHFIAKAEEDSDAKDEEHILSPSPLDLIEMSNSLEQTRRDIFAKIELSFRRQYGNKTITPSDLAGQVLKIWEEGSSTRDRIEKPLKQINKPHADFIIGKVSHRTTGEPRRVWTSHANAFLSHYMDWSICEVSKRVGRNQHRYRSNCDALADNSLCDEDQDKKPGEMCYETCDIEPGVKVCYVGQKSGYRTGIVSPTVVLTSSGSKKFSEWAIIGEDGSIPLESVEGDSGAWVIRLYDNKVMGQVVAHAAGQILFTPINVVFADIKDQLCLDEDISLPRPLGHHPSDQASTTAVANQLCAKKDEPKISIYSWLEEQPMKDIDLSKHLTTGDSVCLPINCASMLLLKETDDEIDDKSWTKSASSERASSPSVPSLTESSSISEAGSDSTRADLLDPIEPLDSLPGCAGMEEEPSIEIVGGLNGSSQLKVYGRSMSVDIDAGLCETLASSVPSFFDFTLSSKTAPNSPTRSTFINRGNLPSAQNERFLASQRQRHGLTGRVLGKWRGKLARLSKHGELEILRSMLAPQPFIKISELK